MSVLLTMFRLEHHGKSGLWAMVNARMTLILKDRGGGFSSRRRAEAIDSAFRDRGVTGPLAGMRVRKGVFGEQPQGETIDDSIGQPRLGGGRATGGAATESTAAVNTCSANSGRGCGIRVAPSHPSRFRESPSCRGARLRLIEGGFAAQ